ncbi:MAG: type IV pili methyl-accepting chemotaxis transducer N-terminal domain-containing protein [Spirochaetes bacterium]|nr:type IV pili methyl-accepting chemotaxis transducer N-terminal domain-containing protein [Spirochaetota bacterium]
MKPESKQRCSLVYVYARYIFLAVVIAAYSIAIYAFVSDQIDDNMRLNSVGRLRMLTQKITKDILLYREGAVSGETVRRSIRIFHSSLHAAALGGPVQLDIKGIEIQELPITRDRETALLLGGIIERWKPFRAHLERFIDDRNERSLRYILEKNVDLLDTIDRAVLTIQSHASRDQVILGLIVSSAILIVIGALIVALARDMRRLRETSRRLREIERLLPICSNCKKIRNEEGTPDNRESWVSIETYLRENREMLFTHSLCPECQKKLYPDIFKDDK